MKENFKFVISNPYSHHLNTNRYCTRLPLPALPLNVNNEILVSVIQHTSTRYNVYYIYVLCRGLKNDHIE